MYLNMNIFRGKKVMKLLAGLLLVGAVAGCAYDPELEGVDVNPEFHASDLNEDQDESEDKGIDFVVNENTVLTSVPEKIGRLIFMQDAVLSTDGASLKLVVDEVISHGGVISTLPRSSKPERGADGLSGGSLYLEARTGRGHLTIISEGQNGGEGVKGDSGIPGAKGPRGSNGEADYELDCLFASPESNLSSFLERPEPRPCFKRWYCSRQTGDGGRGGKGGRGKSGGEGGSGGDSAKVLVKVEDPSQLSISTEVSVGLGGLGGAGGNGGRGGAGGDAGSQDSKRKCRRANRGPEGALGDRGPRGPNGRGGTENPVCLMLGGARIGDCRDFEEVDE